MIFQVIFYHLYLSVMHSMSNLKVEIGSSNPDIINEDFDYLDNFFSEITNSIQDYSFEEKLEIENFILEFCASTNPLEYFENELAGFNIIKSSEDAKSGLLMEAASLWKI
jgi:hypothetical protein